jgi:F-type H+-transporting ATPase subunit gamma
MGLHAFFSQTGTLNTSALTAKTKVVIVFGSDHGLCGSYNETLAGHVAEQLVDTTEEVVILCVGAQMADALRDQHLVPETTFFPPASVDGIGRLANLLTRHLDDMRGTQGMDNIAVSLAYFTRDGGRGQRPEVIALLPLDPDLVRELQEKPWASRSLPSFSMSPPALLQALIHSHLFASMFRAAAEALVTENAARLALMSQAEQSVDDRLEALTSETRAVRQSEITTEILDVIIGFEALKKKSRRSGE